MSRVGPRGEAVAQAVRYLTALTAYAGCRTAHEAWHTVFVASL